MLRELFRRVAIILLLLLAIFLGTKGLLRTIPGDPVDFIIAETGSNADPEILRRDLGLDRGFWEATMSQLKSLVLHFDWGRSIIQKRAIGPILVERAVSTAALSSVALAIAVVFSFFFSMAVSLPHRFQSHSKTLLRSISAVMSALPTAWIGPILILVFAVKFRLFSLSDAFLLPALTLALALSGFWLRVFSETIESELRSDVVRTARSKGVNEPTVVWKHAFLPAAGPLAAFLGSQTGALFAGTVVTETIFDRPGLGSLVVESIFKRDYPLIESAFILSSAFILFGNFAGDLLQVCIRPRMRDGLGDESRKR